MGQWMASAQAVDSWRPKSLSIRVYGRRQLGLQHQFAALPAIFPESEADRTRRGHRSQRNNIASGIKPVFDACLAGPDRRSIATLTVVETTE
jgi:hypothetical protein